MAYIYNAILAKGKSFLTEYYIIPQVTKFKYFKSIVYNDG